MKAAALPPRTCNSPCIKFANFEDGKYNINLIRLIKPYANGDTYIVYKFTDCDKETLRWSAFKTLEKAETEFDCLVAAWAVTHKMTSGGRTRNYDLPRPTASASPAPRVFLGKTHYRYAVGQVNGDTFYCASPRFEGTTCIAVLKGGTLVARYKTEYDMLAGVNAYHHYNTAQPITSLGMFVDEMEDEQLILAPPAANS